MRVAIVGARGQLGAAVAEEFRRGHEVRALGRAALDITDAAAVDAALSPYRPDVIVNCAAYNAVDAAEDDPLQALAVNAFGVRTLSRIAQSTGSVLVHYSSDFVFDGTANAPYTEDDRTNPQSVYATSKLLGEWFAAEVPRSYVLRVESLFGKAAPDAPARGSLQGILQSLSSGTVTKVFEDRTVSPTYVLDAARATRQLVEMHAPPGLYHCVNTGRDTWADIAREAARLLHVTPDFERLRLQDVPMRAARPKYCALSNQKLTSLGIAMPTWQESLAKYVTGEFAGGVTPH